MSEVDSKLTMTVSRSQRGVMDETYDVEMDLRETSLTELGQKFIRILQMSGFNYIDSIIFNTGKDLTGVTDIFFEVDKDGDAYSYDRTELCEAMGSTNMEDMD